MTEKNAKRRARLNQAEAVLRALENDEVDVVLGKRGISLLRVQEMQDQLSRQQELFQGIIDNIPVLLCIWDPDLEQFQFNQAMEDTLGWTVEDTLDGKFMSKVYPDPAYRQEVSEFMLSFTPGWKDLRTTAKNGEVVDVSWANVRLKDGRSIGIGIDVRQRKQFERELKSSRDELDLRVKERTAELEQTVNQLQTEVSRRELAEKVLFERSERLEEANKELKRRARQLQKLAMQLSTAEDRERHRIAEVLHDDLQQILVGARFHLDSLAHKLPEGEDDPLLQEVVSLLGESIEKSRTLSHELSPPALKRSGLVAALEGLREQKKQRYDLDVEVSLDPDAEPASEALKFFLFKAAREMLFNVVKHSGVHKAHLSLAKDDGTLRLAVRDEGKGVDVQDLSSDSGLRGLGLFSIRERLELMGGRLEVESIPGDGSRFTVIVPDTPEPR
ncbi:MAG: ATP-binding protein [Phycisphaerae bacterium]